MHGEVSETQIAGFLIALRTKGETVEELAGLARTMRELAAHVPIERDDLLDTAGTGGGRSTFNVSTTAALIAAGAGCAVAKHGNRSATSRSGSADLLEALGARIDLGPRAVARCIDEAGFGFMFAPAHHQATRFVVPRPARAGRAHDLQPARAADEPGRCPPPADRRLRPALPGDDGRRARAAGRRPGAGRRRRGRPRRDLRAPRRRGSSRSTARSSAPTCSSPRTSACDADARPSGSRAARREQNAAVTRAILGRRGRAAPPGERSRSINAGAAIYAAGARRDRSPRASRRARAASSTDARARAERYAASAASRRDGHAREPGVRERARREILAKRARTWSAAAASVPIEPSSQPRRPRPRARRVPRGARARPGSS